MKKIQEAKIKRTEYSLVEGNDHKFHVRRQVGYNVTYLYSTKVKDDAMRFYEDTLRKLA